MGSCCAGAECKMQNVKCKMQMEMRTGLRGSFLRSKGCKFFILLKLSKTKLVVSKRAWIYLLSEIKPVRFGAPLPNSRE